MDGVSACFSQALALSAAFLPLHFAFAHANVLYMAQLRNCSVKILALVAIAALLFGCASTQGAAKGDGSVVGVKMENVSGEVRAQKGDVVAVDYVGTLDGGAVFDTSLKGEAERAGMPLRPAYQPLEFTVGAGQMIPGFDAAVVGMKEGEEKSVRLLPSEAYGEIRGDWIVEIPRANVPNETEVGAILRAENGLEGRVVDMGNETVRMDFNHELAGKALTFKIIIRKITRRY